MRCDAESYGFISNSNGTAGRLRGLDPRGARTPPLLLSSFALVQIAFLITDTEEMQHVAASSEMMHAGSYLALCFTSCKQPLKNEADPPLITVE